MDRYSATNDADTACNLMAMCRDSGLKPWRLKGREPVPVVHGGMDLGFVVGTVMGHACFAATLVGAAMAWRMRHGAPGAGGQTA